MTIIESLQSLSNYPISDEYIQATLAAEGMDGTQPFTPEAAKETGYLRAKRQVCLYIATAPNISQGGISYSLDATARGQYLDMASDIAEELSDDDGGRFGYIADEL